VAVRPTTALQRTTLSKATDFTSSCSGLACTFTAETGGNVQSRKWFFGDGSDYFPESRIAVTAGGGGGKEKQ
jgi:hypothetical protein